MVNDDETEVAETSEDLNVSVEDYAAFLESIGGTQLNYDMHHTLYGIQDRIEEEVAERERIAAYNDSAIGSRTIIMEALYPPLRIVEIPSDVVGVGTGRPINVECFIIPKSFNETFKSQWKSEDLSQGRINSMYSYSGTRREIAMTFTLAALTVGEARSNLGTCEQIARTVYGRYRRSSTGDRDSTVFAGHKEFKIDFGSLIRDERVFINKFNFTVNVDSGVFDYYPGGDTDVTHSTKGYLLPREVNVEVGFTVVHDYLLGFGGQNRPGERLRWAENRNKDWPHGTGPIPVQEYMSASDPVPLSNLPEIIRPTDPRFVQPPTSEREFLQLLEEEESERQQEREQEVLLATDEASPDELRDRIMGQLTVVPDSTE
tara:strand:+ start:223 stop:1344 length:1122 start_codon:yes stop_codon:yes gene_type:complete